MKARHGVVIGKFYPPHAGHHLLVRTAAAASERVTVVVMAAHVESIGLERRVEWMREVHASEENVTVAGIWDDVPTDFGDPAIWAAHVALMREAVATVTDAPVDACFTSEPYGDELARRLGARHVCVDEARTLWPVSATAVRRDPVAHWDFLAPCVRAGLALRVVLVGAESTGKTTLAAQLAHSLRAHGGAHGLTRWVPEYGREATLDKWSAARAEAALAAIPPPAFDALTWTSADFNAIARRQVAREDEEARWGGPVLICDTDAFATGVWHERYLSQRSADVEVLGDSRPHALYLLTHPADVAFHQDGIRDGEAIRDWMTDRFVARLQETGRRWQLLRGHRHARLAHAQAAIDALLTQGWQFADPLG